MILADKIIQLRKEAGWSQEELAEKIGVSRQSISKWEGAQSIPDMKKILKLSEVFQVSTDYLLKDEIEIPNSPVEVETLPAVDDSGEALTPVSIEEAGAFLDFNKQNAGRIAFGVALCILSPILLILLAVIGASGRVPFNENQGGIAGLIVLLLVVAAAVVLFIRSGSEGRPFEYLKTESLDTAYGVDSMVRERRTGENSSRDMSIGVALCIIAVIPVLIVSFITDSMPGVVQDLYGGISASILLAFAAAGVFRIVRASMINEGYDILLEEGDYTRENKFVTKSFGGWYWSIVTALYLLISFVTNEWQITWVIWPVAGVLYGGAAEIFKLRARRQK